MRKEVFILIGGLLLPLSAIAAEQRQGGLHLSYSEGGDIVDSSAGLGGQVEFPVSAALGVQFAVTRFSEEDNFEDVGTARLDIATFGVSAIFRSRGEGSTLYLLAGLNYNSFDANIELERAYSAVNVRSDADDDVGFHFGAGAEARISRGANFFLEYRYSSSKLETTTEVDYQGQSASFESEGDFDFGLLKMGINLAF